MPFAQRPAWYDSWMGQVFNPRRPSLSRRPVSSRRILTHSDAAPLERTAESQFLEAIRQLMSDPSVQFAHLRDVLSDPNVPLLSVIDAMPWADFERKFEEVQTTLIDAIAAGARPESLGLGYTFDAVNPRVLTYAAKHAAERVTSITQEQRQYLRNQVIRSHLAGVPPMTLAREIRGSIGLTPKWARAVENYHRGLLAKGTDLSLAGKLAGRYHDRLLRARAKMIARTEIMSASNWGKVEAWSQAMDRGLIGRNGATKRWHTAADNVCPICLPMGVGERSRVAIDAEFILPNGKGVFTPPAHPHCRCTITLVPKEIDSRFYEDELVSNTVTDLDSAVLGLDQVPDSSNLHHAESWARQHFGNSRHIDYLGLSPSVASELNRFAVWAGQNDPDTWGRVKEFGSSAGIHWNLTIGHNTLAQASNEGWLRLNQYHGNFSRARFDTLVRATTEIGPSGYRFHPEHVDNLFGILIHELGHHAYYRSFGAEIPDRYIGGREAPARLYAHIRQQYGNPTLAVSFYNPAFRDLVRRDLSEYATASWHEFVAEGYAEYHMARMKGVDPGRMATAVALWFEEVFG